jgi:hypothetical protein
MVERGKLPQSTAAARAPIGFNLEVRVALSCELFNSVNERRLIATQPTVPPVFYRDDAALAKPSCNIQEVTSVLQQFFGVTEIPPPRPATAAAGRHHSGTARNRTPVLQSHPSREARLGQWYISQTAPQISTNPPTSNDDFG